MGAGPQGHPTMRERHVGPVDDMRSLFLARACHSGMQIRARLPCQWLDVCEHPGHDARERDAQDSEQDAHGGEERRGEDAEVGGLEHEHQGHRGIRGQEARCGHAGVDSAKACVPHARGRPVRVGARVGRDRVCEGESREEVLLGVQRDRKVRGGLHRTAPHRNGVRVWNE